jgi:hypothetical protein
MRDLLTPEKAFIFRITHRDNLPWILTNGLHCRNSNQIDSNFVSIGNPDLIDKRSSHPVKIPPGGTLSDYVPFYFTPLSPMLLNIRTGFNGIKQRANEEVVILVASLRKIEAAGIRFVFTDRHAFLNASQPYSDLANLDKIDWRILQNKDFRKDVDDLGKMERYMAEVLIYKTLPTAGLLGVACYNDDMVNRTKEMINHAGVQLSCARRTGWYF